MHLLFTHAKLTFILIITCIQIIMLQKDDIYFCLKTYFFLSIFHWHENTFVSAAEVVKAKLHVWYLLNTQGVGHLCSKNTWHHTIRTQEYIIQMSSDVLLQSNNPQPHGHNTTMTPWWLLQMNNEGATTQI